MKAANKRIVRMLIRVASIIAIFVSILPIKVHADSSNVLTPTDDQYFELRAVTVKDVAGQNKQVIMELWGHNLQFKGFTVRFSFDDTKIEPSNFTTNQITYDSDEYFKFEDEFDGKLDFFSPGYNGEGAGIEATVSLDPPVSTTSHIKYAEGIGNYIDTGEDLLLGKMSFQMNQSLYDESWFNLEESQNLAPGTGIKIVVSVSSYYEAQSTFRFTNETASSDADLTSIVLSHGEVNQENPEESTYKEYDLSPTFDKDTLNYQITLLDNIDYMDLKVLRSEEHAILKVEIPKRDEDGILIYEDDLTTIKYEEKDLTSGEPLRIIINELGLPDTRIKITVLAEDQITKKEYTVLVKRPYATVKGKVYTTPTITTTTTYNAEVYAYSTDDTGGVIDWATAISNTSKMARDDVYQQITQLEERHKVETEDDGSFEFKVIPGTYDFLVTKDGYLDRYFINATVNEGDELDLVAKNAEYLDGNEAGLTNINDVITLFAGDVNKNGVVELLDKAYTAQFNGFTETNFNPSDYETAEVKPMQCDFNDNGKIELLDKAALAENNGKTRKIIDLT